MTECMLKLVHKVLTCDLMSVVNVPCNRFLSNHAWSFNAGVNGHVVIVSSPLLKRLGIKAG